MKETLVLIVYVSSVYSQWFFTPTVETRQGRVRGLRSGSQDIYYGITYAVSERFQPPRDPPKWEGVFTAVGRLGHCAQQLGALALGSEQCLQLDLYAPRPVPRRPLPVLVFLHGGAYYYGTKAHYDPEFLVVKDVIVVIVNFRVGVLGFLCLGDVANLGLKDQVAALKWIQANVAAFGGDPDNVTLCGQSAGAAAAAMHILSASSAGLFHKAILMSGNPLAPWAFNLEPHRPAYEDANKISAVKTEKDVFNVFANASLPELLGACRDVSINPRYFKYTPCVDNHLPEPFFNETPYNIIKSGKFNKVPIMMGYTDVEGMLFYGLNNDRTFEEWNDNFEERLPSVFSWCSDSDKVEITDKIKRHYFKNKPVNRTAVKGVVGYYSDWIAYATADAFADLVAEHSVPVYRYIFEYEGERNFAKFIFGGSTRLRGASHSDDIFYVFRPAGLPLLLAAPDRLFIDRLTTMITNFMKYGDPTPIKNALLPVRWEPATPLRLGRRLTHGRRKNTSTLQKLLCTYGEIGYVPCERTSKGNGSLVKEINN